MTRLLNKFLRPINRCNIAPEYIVLIGHITANLVASKRAGKVRVSFPITQVADHTRFIRQD